MVDATDGEKIFVYAVIDRQRLESETMLRIPKI